MHPHERGPAVVRGIEGGEPRAVGIRAPRADHDCADRAAGAGGEVLGEGGFHGGRRVLGEGEVVAGGGGGDEGVDGGEGVRGGDEDGGEGGGEGGVRGEEGEVEEEEDEAVFAAVVGEGERFEAVRVRHI